jgi:hypothetical protein
MFIKRLGDFTRLPDNDLLYYDYLQGYLDSIDHYANLLIDKTETKIRFRLTPSEPKLLLPLLTAVKEIHTKYHIQVEFAKSIKTSNSITFIIPL